MNTMYIHVHVAIASTHSPLHNVLHHENNLWSLKYWLQVKFNIHHFLSVEILPANLSLMFT